MCAGDKWSVSVLVKNHLSVWVNDEWSESISIIVSGLMGFIGFEIRSTPENQQKPTCRFNYIFPISAFTDFSFLQHLLLPSPQMVDAQTHKWTLTRSWHISTSVGRDSSYLWLWCVNIQHKQMRWSQWNITTQSRSALNMCFDSLASLKHQTWSLCVFCSISLIIISPPQSSHHVEVT